MNGVVEAIYSAPAHGEPQQSADSALVTTAGLQGDRHVGSGVVSIIEAEAVERFAKQSGIQINPGQTGRNIVTRGVRLNPLVGQRFRIGDVVLESFELCEPCATLGARLATDAVPAADVVSMFVHGAGIRAKVIEGGELQIGDPVATGH